MTTEERDELELDDWLALVGGILATLGGALQTLALVLALKDEQEQKGALEQRLQQQTRQIQLLERELNEIKRRIYSSAPSKQTSRSKYR